MQAQEERMLAMRADIAQLTEMVKTLVTNQTAQVVHHETYHQQDREFQDFRREGPRGVKLDFPYFDGTDPAGWIFKASHYFDYHQTPPAQRLLMASYHMNGDALIWYQDAAETAQFNNWDTFSSALLLRFGLTAYDDPMEALTRLKQVSTVVIYKAQFEALSNRLRGLTESHKLSCFLSGLRDEIRLPVRMFKPLSLNVAFGLAKIQEEYLSSSKHSGKSWQEGQQPETKLEISLNAITGTPNQNTMRIHGFMGGERVLFLVDSGSTHNFLDPSIARKAKLKVNTNQKLK
ncbi:hypothetical protein F2P56_019406, partial [Juglans regia]